MNNVAIEAPNVSVAWLRAIRHILSCRGECFNLMVTIHRPAEVQPEIGGTFETLLADHGLLDLRQVAYTIFPRSLYLGVSKDPGKLFDRYNRRNGVYERLKRRYPQQITWGTYFRRLTRYPTVSDSGDRLFVNQLAEIIARMKERSKTYKSAYIMNLVVPGTDGRRIIGDPCLNYAALQLEPDRRLNMLAVYRNHDFIQRAYGNYLGLGYLIEFLSDSTDYTPGALTCISSHATIANVHGAASWPSISELRATVSQLGEIDEPL